MKKNLKTTVNKKQLPRDKKQLPRDNIKKLSVPKDSSLIGSIKRELNKVNHNISKISAYLEILKKRTQQKNKPVKKPVKKTKDTSKSETPNKVIEPEKEIDSLVGQIHDLRTRIANLGIKTKNKLSAPELESLIEKYSEKYSKKTVNPPKN